MGNQIHASYRMTFNLTDEQQTREYNMLKEMSIRERSSFMHLAIGLLGRRIGYKYPEDGMMGVFASLTGNSSQNITIPKPEVLPKTPRPKNRTQDDIPVSDKEINKATPIPDEPEDEAAAFIAGTLAGFDDEL